MNLLALSSLLAFAAVDVPEVLCERTTFVRNATTGTLATWHQRETTQSGNTDGVYCLSAVTVPPAGWKVDAITIYTTASSPEKWLQLAHARLNVLRRSENLPTPDDDPRRGQEVKVEVHEIEKGTYSICASNLDLQLSAGEYWIGLTPIIDRSVHGNGGHILTTDVRNARFDDIVRSPDGDGGAMPYLKEWQPLGPRIFMVLNEHLAIKIEGKQLQRGQLVSWPKDKEQKEKRIFLRFATFDPLSDTPDVLQELASPPDASLWVVQSQSTVDETFRRSLKRAGATLLRYLPDDAYIVSLDSERLQSVRELKSVRWVGPYHPAYRIDQNVFPEPFDRPSFFDRLPRNESEGVRRVRLFLFNRSAAAKSIVAEAVRDAGGETLHQSQHGFYLVANIPKDRIAVVAQCDEICAIERALEGFEPQQVATDQYGGPEARLTMNEIRELCGANRLKEIGGYEGLGVRVAFWDDNIRTDHIDLLARRPITFVGPRDRANGNHGTAIAGILCGEGRGNPRARGLLPLGSIVFASYRNHAIQDEYGVIAQFVGDHEAALMSSSAGGWGGMPFVNHYDGYAALLDELVLKHDLVFCTAIGNGSARMGQAGSWAKNVVHVGGVDPEGSVDRNDHRPLRCTTGPASDGRVKPDLVHFGYGVYTASATGPLDYENFAGTSCATPLVAGMFGLMMEAWADDAFIAQPLGRTVTAKKPGAATAKAMMINSAFKYPVGAENAWFTRHQQGWGMPDVGRLYESRKKLFVVDQERAIGDRQAVEYQLRVSDGEPELRVTMAYSDPPAAIVAAKALINDLDLIVVAPDGKRYHGNYGLLQKNASTEGGSADRANNVENVFVDSPSPGVWRILIITHRVAWDQREDTEVCDQDFGLVVFGVEPGLVPQAN